MEKQRVSMLAGGDGHQPPGTGVDELSCVLWQRCHSPCRRQTPDSYCSVDELTEIVCITNMSGTSATSSQVQMIMGVRCAMWLHENFFFKRIKKHCHC